MKSLPHLAVALTMMAALVALPMADAEAQRYPGELGIGVGSATKASGLSLKFPAGPTAFQLTAGCSGSCDGVAASFDVLASMPTLASHDVMSLAWNFGGGGAVGAGDEFGIAASFILGLEFHLRPVPIDFVMEWRPNVELIPDVGDFSIDSVGGHLRFYF